MSLVPYINRFRASLLGVPLLTMLGIFLVASSSSYGQPSDSQDSPVLKIPRSNWYYRWGESPENNQGVPVWIYEDTSNPGWKPMESSSQLLKDRQGHHNLWLMIQLPQGHWEYPAILLPPVFHSFAAYQNQRNIYQFGKLGPSDSSKYSAFRWHSIPLASIEGEIGDDILFLRIYSDSQNIGVAESKAWLGSQIELPKLIIRLSIADFVLGSLFIFAGLLSIFVYFRRRRQKLYPVLFFGAFATCIGVNHLGGSVGQLLIGSTAIWYYVAMTASLLWPIGLYLFIEEILGRGYKSLIRRIWQAHIAFAVCVFLLDAANLVPMLSLLPFFFGLLMIGIFITFPIAVRAALKGNFEARILNIGMGILMLSGLHDILASFGLLPLWHFLFSWGVFVFMLFLAYILEHRFAQAHQQLEEYSLTLEQKVEDRTQELSEKNEALEQALQQLKEAQSQMVMQAKMASLGDLVAGVAHEMNNPIGVIHSAADIANRGIRKIKELLPWSSARPGVDKPDSSEEQLQKSFNLVESNNEIITEASDRVAMIVRCLRMFASLDEALFQRVNIHENIDTTLALMYHELRDKATVTKEYGEIPRIQCYPNELNQAFMNLLRNAGQAIEQQGNITIATYADEVNVYMKISDTGKGIPSEDLPRVFDPGFTTWGHGVGKGLGLPIVYSVVQKHHGDIEVQSEVGKGTEIAITLPIEQPRES